MPNCLACEDLAKELGACGIPMITCISPEWIVVVLGVTLRAGLHTGECESANGDLGGVAVEITAAVMSSAAPGAVLVSSTVKDLVLGAPFDFDGRGSYTLVGSTEAWRLFELRGQS